jgi:hypothetical protein
MKDILSKYKILQYSTYVDAHSRDFSRRELLGLQILVFFLFFGRAWQAIFLELPVRELLWDEYIMTSVVNFFGYTWSYYVRNSDAALSQLSVIIGIFWGICAILTWQIHRLGRFLRIFWWFGVFLLVCLSFLYCKEMFWAWGQFLEYSLQVTAPIFLIFAARRQQANSPAFRFWLQISIGITFFSHGLYAYGYYPQPVAWVDWCIIVFIMSENVARKFLIIIGILDFAKLFAVFIPLRRLQFVALWYCVLWGFITALARIVANYSYDLPSESLFIYTPETLFRLVHGGIPLLLWSLWHRPILTK